MLGSNSNWCVLRKKKGFLSCIFVLKVSVFYDFSFKMCVQKLYYFLICSCLDTIVSLLIWSNSVAQLLLQPWEGWCSHSWRGSKYWSVTPLARVMGVQSPRL